MLRPFRFGLAVSNGLADSPVERAIQAEAEGFDVAVIGDHIGPELAPLPTLAAVAARTASIRIGTMVLNADVRNPVQLAWQAATIGQLSGGRFELGLGAGHTPQEYAAMGLEQDPGSVRKRRLMEAVEVISDLLAGQEVSRRGEYHDIVGASVSDGTVAVPILVGGNGAALLEHAGRHADIVGLQGLGRTLEDGHRHTVRWDTDHLERQVEQIHRGAEGRARPPELSALVQVVEVTDDASAATAALCARVPGLSADVVDDAPYVLFGTVDEIAAKIERCRSRWGISYFVVRDNEQFAPVIPRLRGRTSPIDQDHP